MCKKENKECKETFLPDDMDILDSISSDFSETMRDLISIIKEIKKDIYLIKKQLNM
jgi:hypothetical protein